MGYKVRLDVFEGPFDLLVYLIESARMSIYDIKVAEITTQYLKYIEEMQQMNVAVSSEFMVLAAELIDLKSKMLLPRAADPESGEAAEDPRTDLTMRILEYKKFKIASEMLREGEQANFHILISLSMHLTVFFRRRKRLKTSRDVTSALKDRGSALSKGCSLYKVCLQLIRIKKFFLEIWCRTGPTDTT